jgi:regulator of protease activity HflC (stomatin/prohibitin superfamily)
VTEALPHLFLAAVSTFLGLMIGVPVALTLLRKLGFYAIVQERTAQVFELFGSIVLVLDQPGLHLLWPRLTWRAPLIGWLGRVRTVDLRLDQQYLRSLAVNTEEGAPMGIGVWFEMFISDPVAYLFKNVDPRGSLAANVSNSTVRSLSNMPLAHMLTDRHQMSQMVRAEVSPESGEWGYALGSVYVRKVHFRDPEMIKQIESKVINRLRQVTSAIKQDGANQVNVITSSAEKTAAAEFARAAAMRPKIVGEALGRIAQDPEVASALFEALEIKSLLESGARVTVVPPARETLDALLASAPGSRPGPGAEPPKVRW